MTFKESVCLEHTLKLYGNSRPFLRSQTIRAYGPLDDEQSTLIDSPGRRYDLDGSNFKYGSRWDAKLLKENGILVSIWHYLSQKKNSIYI